MSSEKNLKLSNLYFYSNEQARGESGYEEETWRGARLKREPIISVIPVWLEKNFLSIAVQLCNPEVFEQLSIVISEFIM